jgi:hypothetical protein
MQELYSDPQSRLPPAWSAATGNTLTAASLNRPFI